MTTITGVHRADYVLQQTASTWCWVCGVEPDAPCDCEAGCFHLARFLRAHDEHRISAADVIRAIRPETFDAERVCGATVILPPEATP